MHFYLVIKIQKIVVDFWQRHYIYVFEVELTVGMVAVQKAWIANSFHWIPRGAFLMEKISPLFLLDRVKLSYHFCQV